MIFIDHADLMSAWYDLTYRIFYSINKMLRLFNHMIGEILALSVTSVN